jgi:predicted Zn-dependent protease with MMP-like domain
MPILALHSGAYARCRNSVNQEEFEDAVRDALAGLPGWVRGALDNIEVLVEDEAGDDLDPEGEGLLGLYVGLPLPERGIDYAGELPDVIYLFRLPHLELGLPPDELGQEIARTLIHEIAHYFGIDDDHLDEIGWG